MFCCPSEQERDGAFPGDDRVEPGSAIVADVDVGALLTLRAVVCAVPLEVLVFGGEDEVAASVIDVDAEVLQFVVGFQLEHLVAVEVGSESIGEPDGEHLDADPEGGVVRTS